MFPIVIFALLSVASAQYVSQYGVNPIAHKYPVQTYGQNYGYGAQKVIPSYNSAQIYGQNYGYGAQKVIPTYSAAQTYAGPGVGYSRDFNIEQVGEKYAYNNGPASFQYSFLKGTDLTGQGYEPAVAAYGVPHHSRVAAEVPHYGSQYPSVYGAKLSTY